MMQGCRLARLFGKSIMGFYARNQYFLMNTQPNGGSFFVCFFPFYDIFNAVKVISNFNVYVAQKKKYFLCKERF